MCFAHPTSEYSEVVLQGIQTEFAYLLAYFPNIHHIMQDLHHAGCCLQWPSNETFPMPYIRYYFYADSSEKQ